MRMNRKAALFASATLGVAFLAACSDSATAPTQQRYSHAESRVSRSLAQPRPPTRNSPCLRSARLVTPTDRSRPHPRRRSHQVARAARVARAIPKFRVRSLLPRLSAESQRSILATLTRRSADFFTVTEAPPAVVGTTQVLESCVETAGPIPCGNPYFVNTATALRSRIGTPFPPRPRRRLAAPTRRAGIRTRTAPRRSR